MNPDAWRPAVVLELIRHLFKNWTAWRQRRKRLGRRYEGFHIRIGSMRRLDDAARTECSKLALDMRRFFIANPDQCRGKNREFFDEYLAEPRNPTDADWTDERWLGFVLDGEELHAV